MGKSFSKDRFGKVNDFSLPFMNPELQKNPDEWKELEDEKNRALADKKRFAIRLSEVEEMLAKKSDKIRTLEMEIQDSNQRHRIAAIDLQMLENEAIHLRGENKLHLLQIQSLKTENTALLKELQNKLTIIPSTESPIAAVQSTQSPDAELSSNGLQEYCRSQNPTDYKNILKLLEEKDSLAATYAEQLRHLQEEFSQFKSLQFTFRSAKGTSDKNSNVVSHYKSKEMLTSVDKGFSSVDHSADSLTSTEIQ